MKQIDNRERKLIKEIADNIHISCETGRLRMPYMKTESYWEPRVPVQNESVLEEYDFDNPLELKKMLARTLKEDGMADFITSVTVAAFKKRGETVTAGEISAYIYEF